MRLKIPELGNETVEFPDEVGASMELTIRRNGDVDIVSSGFDDDVLPELNGEKLIDSEMADMIKREIGFDCRKPYWDIKVIDSSDSGSNKEVSK